MAHGGEEWIKISTITESRLLFEIAKAQWETGDSSSNEEDLSSTGNCAVEEDDLTRVELVKIADDLNRASQAHRIHYKNPRVRFVLPKISAYPPPELHPILDRIRSRGAVIDLGYQDVPFDNLDNIFSRLLPSPHPPLTDTLNIDCTILLALVSDLSHAANHPVLPSYNAAIIRQIEIETRDHLLPSSLWPAMADKDLVCTQEASKRMREIVATIGMPNEVARAELVLDDGQEQQGKDLRVAFAKYSDYPIPSSWRLPIRIVSAAVSDSDIATAIGANILPSVAQRVAKQLTDINRSVFMYGWMQSVTTVSSNRTVAKQIEEIVEKQGGGVFGPDIWCVLFGLIILKTADISSRETRFGNMGLLLCIQCSRIISWPSCGSRDGNADSDICVGYVSPLGVCWERRRREGNEKQ